VLPPPVSSRRHRPALRHARLAFTVDEAAVDGAHGWPASRRRVRPRPRRQQRRLTSGVDTSRVPRPHDRHLLSARNDAAARDRRSMGRGCRYISRRRTTSEAQS
jgi:hypothetical protein